VDLKRVWAAQLRHESAGSVSDGAVMTGALCGIRYETAAPWEKPEGGQTGSNGVARLALDHRWPSATVSIVPRLY
jgi:hypothetical protein